MKLTGKIIGANVDFKSGKPCVSFEVNEMHEFRQMVDEMRNNPCLSIEVKPFRPRRSLDANAYAWVLMDRLAAALGESKERIYREYIRNIAGNSEIVCVRDSAVDRLCDGWRKNGLGWQTEIFPSKIKGCTNVVLYYGSSTYDSAQMSRLIDLIIADCKEQGIQTDTPDEIARLKALWEGK